MVEIPQDVVTDKDVADWYVCHEQLRLLKSKESLLRSRIFKARFPNPEEGTNDFPLADGYVMKGIRKISRDVDKAALEVFKKPLEGENQNPFEKAQITIEDLIEYKPSLVLSAYRKLTDAQRLVFDQILSIKDGMPDLKIVMPAKNKPKE